MGSIPGIFGFYAPDEIHRYYANSRAVSTFGHDPIIRCIELACRHETGAVRDLNADHFPIAGVTESLLIVRTPDNRLIFALVDEELPVLKAWFDSHE